MPSTAASESTWGGNVLHQHAKASKWGELIAVASEKRSKLVTRDECGRTPLHLCLEYGAPTETIIELIQFNPQACSTKNRDKKTPLHVACEFGISLSALLYIVRTEPRAASYKNANNCTPLEVAKAAKLPSAFGYSLGVSWQHYQDQYTSVIRTLENPLSWESGAHEDLNRKFTNGVQPTDIPECFVGVPVDPATLATLIQNADN